MKRKHLLLLAVFGSISSIAVRAQQIRVGVICAGAANLDNGSIVTIGQPFVGLTQAADNTVTIRTGIIPVLIAGPEPVLPGPIDPPQPFVSRFQMTFPTLPGVSYSVAASTNLLQWLNIWTRIAEGDSLLFEDVNTAEFDFRFYRVVIP